MGSRRAKPGSAREASLTDQRGRADASRPSAFSSAAVARGGRGEPTDEGRQRVPPRPLLVALRQQAKDRAAQLGVGEPLEHRDELDRRLRDGLVAEEAGRLEPLHLREQLFPRPLSRRDELRPSVEPGDDALKGDAVEGGVLEHEAAERDDADVDEVTGRIVGLDERLDLAVEDCERVAGERVDDEALLRAEEAVDGAGRGSRRVGDGPDGHRRGAALGDQPLRRRQQCGARPFVVLTRSSHG